MIQDQYLIGQPNARIPAHFPYMHYIIYIYKCIHACICIELYICTYMLIQMHTIMYVDKYTYMDSTRLVAYRLGYSWNTFPKSISTEGPTPWTWLAALSIDSTSTMPCMCPLSSHSTSHRCTAIVLLSTYFQWQMRAWQATNASSWETRNSIVLTIINKRLIACMCLMAVHHIYIYICMYIFMHIFMLIHTLY